MGSGSLGWTGPIAARRAFLLSTLCWLLGCSRTDAAGKASKATEPLRVAVASNFGEPARRVAAAFGRRSGASVEVITGSSGKLYAQIDNGAPLHVFLSADAERPRKLVDKGLAVKGSRFTYAVGRLVLYGPALTNPDEPVRTLERGDFAHLSLANPETAPYGAAAKQVLDRLGLWTKLSSRTARGENVIQALQFVESGAAELGFVALSSVVHRPAGSFWRVPASWHEPIRQQAVLLTRGADHPSARAFLAFLRDAEARQVIEAAGYSIDGDPLSP